MVVTGDDDEVFTLLEITVKGLKQYYVSLFFNYITKRERNEVKTQEQYVQRGAEPRTHLPL